MLYPYNIRMYHIIPDVQIVRGARRGTVMMAVSGLYQYADVLACIIEHIVPDLQHDERVQIMFAAMMLGSNVFYHVCMGNCTREYLLQYNLDWLPIIVAAHSPKE